ncbi:MAG: PD40 domain-containing protein [Saprospiraceae bacterium]|nr:PD40 domain-containing protein [Saprospiraceae bacterium]
MAYFFGGKDSFEVNGWSPDGSKITFVSNGIRTQ